jgi:ribosome recycling factor
MIEDIKQEADDRMAKALEALSHNFNKIRTGRAHPSLLDSIRVEYYGAETPAKSTGKYQYRGRSNPECGGLSISRSRRISSGLL